jgi:hypothetical protein
MRAINRYYANGGKIWFSDKTSLGYSRLGSAIAIGLKDDHAIDELTGAIYNIAHVSPMPSAANRVLFHELGHNITMTYQSDKMTALIEEMDKLRDEQ